MLGASTDVWQPSRVSRRQGSFLVTYGPSGRMWCLWCGKGTLLARRLVDDSLVPAIRHARRTHACGPIGTRWDRRSWR